MGVNKTWMISYITRQEETPQMLSISWLSMAKPHFYIFQSLKFDFLTLILIWWLVSWSVNAIFPQHILACMSGLGSYSFSFFFSFYQCLYLEIWIVMVASLQGSTGWGRKWVVKLYWQPNCCQDMKAFDISIKYIFIHNPKIQCTNIKS